MQGIGEAIKYLYQQFILRDVVAYVTPGAIIAVCVLKILLGTAEAITFVKEIPVAAYLPLYGALFIFGLALENLGETVRILRFHNRRRGKQADDQAHFRKLQDFHRMTSATKNNDGDDGLGAKLERTRERITVKKYASGNIAVALMVSAILILFTKRRPDLSLWAVGVFGAVLVAAMLRAHWFQLHLQTTWEDEALRQTETQAAGVPETIANKLTWVGKFAANVEIEPRQS